MLFRIIELGADSYLNRILLSALTQTGKKLYMVSLWNHYQVKNKF